MELVIGEHDRQLLLYVAEREAARYLLANGLIYKLLVKVP